MGKPHTIIGAEPFHVRVRDGIGWFQHAMAARQALVHPDSISGYRITGYIAEGIGFMQTDHPKTRVIPAGNAAKILGVIWSSLTVN